MALFNTAQLARSVSQTNFHARYGSGEGDNTPNIAIELFQNLVLPPSRKRDSGVGNKYIHVPFLIFAAIVYIMRALPYQSERDVIPRDVDTWTVWNILDFACYLIFTIEFISRLYVAIKTRRINAFVTSILHWIDLLTILPWFIHFISNEEIPVVQLLGLIRVFKLARYSAGTQVVGATISASKDVLLLLLFLCIISSTVFSSMIWFAESGDWDYSREEWVTADGSASKFQHIPGSFYWSIVTTTTLGYGDMVPITTEGKIISCIAMMWGVVMIAMPISILGDSFSHKWAEHIHKRQIKANRSFDRRAFRKGLKHVADIQTLDDLCRAIENSNEYLMSTTRKMRQRQNHILVDLEKASKKFEKLKALNAMLVTMLDMDERDGVRPTLERLFQTYKAGKAEEDNTERRVGFWAWLKRCKCC